jgi:hypothetical protein
LSPTTLVIFGLPVIAFIAAFVSSRTSLGASIGVLLTVGYFSGIIRANFLHVLTTFMFDMAVFGVYVGVLFNRPDLVNKLKRSSLASWLFVLAIWPLIVAAIPVNDFLIQMLAFRSTVWLLPLMLLGTRLTEDDLTTMARVLVALNLCALVAGLICYFYGVRVLYPENAVTQIIYNSRDVSSATQHFANFRIPSTFLSSAAYGGTMLASMPFIVNRLFNPRTDPNEKLWMFAGLLAACMGIAMCGARSPVVAGVIILLIVWVFSGFSIRVGIPIILGFAAFLFLIFSNERFQRVTSLAEGSVVKNRIQGSRNFFDFFFEYPLGAGMGSSVGTSVPFFLQSRAPRPIGLETEYSRILIDQGWIGLILWIIFLFWLHVPWPQVKGSRSTFKFGTIMIYAASLTTWATAIIGSGTLSAIPGSAMLLINMGIIVARREEFSALRRMPVRRRPPSPQQSWQSEL